MKKILKAFFDWFDPDNFMDTYQEWHAFVEGFAEGFTLFTFPHFAPSQQCLKDIKDEHHYFVAGRAFGFGGFLVLLTVLIVWIIGAIHG